LDGKGFETKAGEKYFFRFSKYFRPALSSNQRPIQWVPGLFLGRGFMLTTHLHLVPRSRLDSVIPLLHLYAFMHGWADLYLLLHGVTFRKNTLLMLTADGFDVMRDKFFNQSLLA
jgi:hypothetical protein